MRTVPLWQELIASVVIVLAIGFVMPVLTPGRRIDLTKRTWRDYRRDTAFVLVLMILFWAFRFAST